MEPRWNNTTPALRDKVTHREMLVLSDLRVQDITQQVDASDVALDWEHTILLKNLPSDGKTRRGRTIVWNDLSGFLLVTASPNNLIDRLSRDNLVSRLDMQAYLQVCQGKNPVPYVVGDFRLIAVGTQQKEQYDWINLKYFQTMIPFKRKRERDQALVMLTNGEQLLIEDTASRMTNRKTTADKIFALQLNQAKHDFQLYRPNEGLSQRNYTTLQAFQLEKIGQVIEHVVPRLRKLLTAKEWSDLVTAIERNQRIPEDMRVQPPKPDDSAAKKPVKHDPKKSPKPHQWD